MKGNHKKGFSLVEIVVAMLILGIVTSVVAGIVQFSTVFFRNENSQLEIQSKMRMIAIDFEKELRKKVTNKDFYKVTSGPCYTLGDPTKTTVKYCQEGNDVKKYIGAATTGTIIGESIESFTATYTLTEQKVVLSITSLPDYRSVKNNINLTIYLRTLRNY